MAPKDTIKSFFRSVLHRRPPAIKARNIKPRDLNKPSFATLNQDVALLIIRCLYDMDPDSVHDVAMVCSALYVWARYVQHQVISLDMYMYRRQYGVLERLRSLSRSGFLPAVRELHVKVDERVEPSPESTVYDPPPRSRQVRERLKHRLEAWHLLCDVIPRMSGLAHLHWTGAVLPNSVLEYLDKNPHIRLHMNVRHITESSSPRAAEQRRQQFALLQTLAANISQRENLSSLKIILENNSSEHSRDVMQRLFKQVLLSNPALRSLSLEIGERQDGCVVGLLDDDPKNCSFGWVDGERPRNPLRELELKGYNWGMPRHDETLARMDYWGRTLDWSQLRRLVLHNRPEIEYRSIQLADFIAPHLVALGEVDFGGYLDDRYDPQIILNFFDRLPSHRLNSITLPFPIPPTAASSFAAHAATLRSLKIYPSPVTPQDIALVRGSFPHLTTLSIVCDRDHDSNSWPYEAFSLLASIPNLQHLTIWFDLGQHDAFLKPFLTMSSADDIFSHLRCHGASQLQLLHLHSGFPPRPRRGLVMFEDWDYDVPSGFVCKTTQDSHGRSDGWQVSCTKLTRTENERLRRDVAAGGEATSKHDWHNMRYRIALKGPLDLSEWKAWKGL